MWVLAAMFAMQVAKGMQESKQAATQNKVAKANAAIQNQLTDARNTVAAAQGALSRFRQSLGNQQILSNAARYNEALAKNLTRAQDQATTGNLNTRIQAAERTGQLMAAASAAGVSGSTVDQLNSLIRGQTARQVQAAERNAKMAESDTLERMRQVSQGAFNGLNETVFIDSINPVDVQAQQREVPSFLANVGTAALSVLGTQAGQDAVGTLGTKFTNWFKTPNAGVQLQVGEGFNPAPGVAQPSFFNVSSMFGGQ